MQSLLFPPPNAIVVGKIQNKIYVPTSTSLLMFLRYTCYSKFLFLWICTILRLNSYLLISAICVKV